MGEDICTFQNNPLIVSWNRSLLKMRDDRSLSKNKRFHVKVATSLASSWNWKPTHFVIAWSSKIIRKKYKIFVKYIVSFLFLTLGKINLKNRNAQSLYILLQKNYLSFLYNRLIAVVWQVVVFLFFHKIILTCLYKVSIFVDRITILCFNNDVFSHLDFCFSKSLYNE